MNSIEITAAFFALWKDYPNTQFTVEDVLNASKGIFPPGMTEEEKKKALEKAYLFENQKKSVPK